MEGRVQKTEIREGESEDGGEHKRKSQGNNAKANQSRKEGRKEGSKQAGKEARKEGRKQARKQASGSKQGSKQASRQASEQASKGGSKQASKEARKQASKEVSKQARKQARKQGRPVCCTSTCMVAGDKGRVPDGLAGALYKNDQMGWQDLWEDSCWGARVVWCQPPRAARLRTVRGMGGTARGLGERECTREVDKGLEVKVGFWPNRTG